MRNARITGAIIAVALGSLSASGLAAATQASATDDGRVAVTAQQEELTQIKNDPTAVIREIVDRFRAEMQPANPSLNIGSGEELITAALKRVSPEKLLAARQAGSYQELRALLQPSWQKSSPGFMALHAGEPITPNLLGDSGQDLVYTPLTPCRIIDTRLATGALAGRIGPSAGKHFEVDMADYTPQGGFAGTCGVPADVAGVVLNVTSTDQTGVGNLRVIESNGGLPTATLLNYVPGVNLANAGVLRSAVGLTDDIFIYSGTNSSHVVVDIMGYFTSPAATALDCQTVLAAIALPANGTASQTVDCAAGYTLTGGGASDTGGAVITVNKLDIGNFVANQMFCRVSNNTGAARTPNCMARCCRVPGH